MHNLAVFIAKNLDLNVMRILDKLLDIHVTITKCLLSLHLCGVVSLHQAHVVMRRAHTTTTTTGNRLDDNGISNLSSYFKCLLIVLDNAGATRRDRNTDFTSGFTGDSFIAHHANGGGFRTDKLDFAALTDFGKVRVLGQEAIAWVNRIDVANFGSADNAIDLQI